MRGTWLVLGGALAAVLIVVGAGTTGGAVDDLSETRLGTTRTPLRSDRFVQLDDRKYVVFYEEDDSALDRPGTPPLEVTIRGLDDGRALPLDDFNGEFTVTSNGRRAEAWLTVKVPRAGRYRISARGRADQAAAPAIVLGRPLLARILRLVTGIVALLSGLGLTALVAAIAIALAVRRKPV